MILRLYPIKKLRLKIRERENVVKGEMNKKGRIILRIFIERRD